MNSELVGRHRRWHTSMDKTEPFHRVLYENILEYILKFAGKKFYHFLVNTAVATTPFTWMRNKISNASGIKLCIYIFLSPESERGIKICNKNSKFYCISYLHVNRHLLRVFFQNSSFYNGCHAISGKENVYWARFLTFWPNKSQCHLCKTLTWPIVPHSLSEKGITNGRDHNGTVHNHFHVY